MFFTPGFFLFGAVGGWRVRGRRGHGEDRGTWGVGLWSRFFGLKVFEAKEQWNVFILILGLGGWVLGGGGCLVKFSGGVRWWKVFGEGGVFGDGVCMGVGGVRLLVLTGPSKYLNHIAVIPLMCPVCKLQILDSGFKTL